MTLGLKKYFKVSAKNLTRVQASRLAAILPNPIRYKAAAPGPYVQRRARWIERQVRQLGGPSYLAPR